MPVGSTPFAWTCDNCGYENPDGGLRADRVCQNCGYSPGMTVLDESDDRPRGIE